jgi:hypothetical protein
MDQIYRRFIFNRIFLYTKTIKIAVERLRRGFHGALVEHSSGRAAADFWRSRSCLCK